MSRRRRNSALLLLAIILVLTASCRPASKAPTATPGPSAKRPTADQVPPTPVRDKATSTPEPAAIPFDVGSITTVGRKKIGSEGGKLVISSPGDPLDGLTVEVPEGAFGEGVDLEVVGLEIEDHSLGEYVNPVTPLIAVTGLEEPAAELLTLTIPIHISPNEFAMAFGYDSASGKLEGMALLESTDNSVKVATRDISRLVLVSKVLVSELYGGSDSAFQHGLDDWYFPNYGSYIAPGGHCAGQSLSAMYYYIEDLGPPLYGRYDNYDNWFEETPDLWQDDEAGYRLASMTQVELDWDGHGRKFWSAFNKKYNDHVVYNAFAYSMLVTEMPQFMGIYGKDKDGKTAGHAIIAYMIDDNQIYVSDPNFPAWAEGGREERTITYDPEAGSFEPYPSGATAGSSSILYDRILYFGYKDLIDWKLMGELWKRLEDGWIGMDKFPFYELVVREADSEEWEPLSNNHVSEGEDILVWMRDYKFAPVIVVFGPDEKEMTHGGAPIPLKLKEGDNWFGLQILGGKPGGEEISLSWIGFDWINIIYEGSEEVRPTAAATSTPRPTSTTSPTSPLKWVRDGAPLVNPAGAPVVFRGGGPMHDWFPEARFEGKAHIYHLSETSIGADFREVDHGKEYYNVSIASTFDAPPPVLTPGESYPLTVNLIHSGTVTEGNPGVRFEYRAGPRRGEAIQPPQALRYSPWADWFIGENSSEWTLVAPMGRPGDTWEVSAFWWNCAACNVTWKYRLE